MALTTSEIESLRHHLGYGNIGASGAPYTPDTFLELFTQVIAPNLSTGTETSAAVAVSEAGTSTVTPAVMTDIVPYATLAVDTGDESEVVIVKSVTATTFVAAFTKAHGAGYPIAVMSGVARLRMMLWDADKAWKKLLDSAIASSGGIKQVDEVEFFEGTWFLKGRLDQYRGIVMSIAYLVQVPPKWGDHGKGGVSRLEAY